MTDERQPDAPLENPVEALRHEALAAAVAEIEAHHGAAGWDQPGTLYALVPTARLLEHEPALADALGLDPQAPAGALTPVEQEGVTADQPLERLIETITWPDAVGGCAAVVERLVLPPGADDALPDTALDAQEYARSHPDRQEVRIVAGVTRDGAAFCALRLRSHDQAESVVTGTDLVPGLVELLHSTFDTEAREDGA